MEGNLVKQLAYLRKLKTMKDRALRRLHDDTFAGTKFGIRIPQWMHRSIVERRLFYYFCAKNYHYPPKHPITKEFRRKAKHILSADYISGIDPEQQTKDRLKELRNFTVTNIKAMPIREVDRYLAGLSLYVEGDERTRRKVLYEWFNEPSKDLPKHYNKSGQKVAARRKGELNNKYKLRELILANPALSYSDFMRHFGNEMPTVSRASYNNARSLLRKEGYDIAPLPKGPSRPVVVSGRYGRINRAKMLNDTTVQGVDRDGETKAHPF